MISVEKYPNNTKTSNRRLNKSYHAGSEHTVRSKRSRRSYPGDQRLMPSAGSRRPRPSGIKMIELDLETRTIIRRIAFSTLIAAGKFFLSYVHSKKVQMFNKKIQVLFALFVPLQNCAIFKKKKGEMLGLTKVNFGQISFTINSLALGLVLHL